MAFILSWFVSHLSFFWCLRKAVLRDYGISWVSSLTVVQLTWQIASSPSSIFFSAERSKFIAVLQLVFVGVSVVSYVLSLQSNLSGSNIFGTMKLCSEICVVRATEN